MSITLECPGCGKRYEIDDRLAGKQAKCKCGTAMRVPRKNAGSAGAAVEGLDDEDWVASAFSSPAPAGPTAAPPEATPIAPPPIVDVRPPPLPERSTSEPPASQRPDEPADYARPRKKKSKAARQRQIVAILAMVYGAVAALALVARSVFSPPDGVFTLSHHLAEIGLAVLIGLGGWMIRQRHPHGPTCAGLACLFLCFFAAWKLMLAAMSRLTEGRLGALLLVLVLGVLFYAIPAVVTAWCLREEMARQKREEEEESLYYP